MTKSSVGYRKPPKHTRFAKGVSGNPRGRPKGSRNLRTLLDTELDRPITIREQGGRSRKLSKAEALIKRMVNTALEGDLRAHKLILEQYSGKDGKVSPDQPTVQFIIDGLNVTERDQEEIEP
jgi:hypothetical protein